MDPSKRLLRYHRELLLVFKLLREPGGGKAERKKGDRKSAKLVCRVRTRERQSELTEAVSVSEWSRLEST